MCKKLSLPLLLALLLLLTACGGTNSPPEQQQPAETPPEPYTLTVASSGDDEEMISHHLFENLMRWVDDGAGFAVLAPGQAESYTVECDYAGFATYHFTLREDLQWSDGEKVTAQHFVDAWQALADPAGDRPGRELLSVVSGYDQVQETGDVSLLGVSALSDTVFIVSLSGACAYFLDELCAGTETMPIRTDLLKDGEMTGTVTNGAFVRSGEDDALLLRSDTYWNAGEILPEQLRFAAAGGAAADYEALQAGTLDLVQALPDAVLSEYAAGDLWVPEPTPVTYAVMLNTQLPPFDDPLIRQAFCLAVDEAAVAAAVGDPTLRPAAGFVPYGVTDHSSQRPAVEEKPEAPVLPDPNSTPEPEKPAIFWDFRAHSQTIVTQDTVEDYAADCLQAKAALAQAGYANGGGFPVVEYLYVASDVNRAAAQALQSMWQEQLGVTVTLRGVSQEEYDAILFPAPAAEEGTAAADSSYVAPENPIPEFTMAAQSFSSPISDAVFFLQRWHSANEENVIGYHSAAFDILIDSALAAVSPEFTDARDAYLHDAEAILLADGVVIPLFCEGSGFALRDGLSGLYRGSDGLLFLCAVERSKEIPSA